jgi:hypothetical protein
MKLWQASISFGLPGTNKTDEDLSAEICATHNMSPDAVKAVKKLYGNHLSPVRSAISRTRQEYKRLTVEGIGGIRVIAVGERQLFLDRMSVRSSEYWALANAFLDRYDMVLEEERISKNGGFKEDDYPRRDALEKFFKFSYSVQPMPMPSQFIIDGITDDLGQKLSQEYAARLEATERQHTETTLRTLRDLISGLAETLNGDGPIVDSENRKGILPRFQEYLDRIPDLNITGDDRITQLYQAAKQSLDYTTEQLRSSRVTRELAAAKATNILLTFGQQGKRKIA